MTLKAAMSIFLKKISLIFRTVKMQNSRHPTWSKTQATWSGERPENMRSSFDCDRLTNVFVLASVDSSMTKVLGWMSNRKDITSLNPSPNEWFCFDTRLEICYICVKFYLVELFKKCKLRWSWSVNYFQNGFYFITVNWFCQLVWKTLDIA